MNKINFRELLNIIDFLHGRIGKLSDGEYIEERDDIISDIVEFIEKERSS